MLASLQLIALVFSLVMVYFALIHYKKHELSKLEITTWFIVWGITILAILFPHVLSKLTNFLPFARLFDLLTVGGFILVITMVSISYVRTKKLEKKIIDLVRKDTLSDIKVKRQ